MARGHSVPAQVSGHASKPSDVQDAVVGSAQAHTTAIVHRI